MKKFLFLLVGMMVIGCLKPVPPEPPAPIVIVVRTLPNTTRTYGQIVDAGVIEDDGIPNTRSGED